MKNYIDNKIMDIKKYKAFHHYGDLNKLDQKGLIEFLRGGNNNLRQQVKVRLRKS